MALVPEWLSKIVYLSAGVILLIWIVRTPAGLTTQAFLLRSHSILRQRFLLMIQLVNYFHYSTS